MLLLFLSLFKPTISQKHHICVCHPNECEYSCPKSSIGINFDTVRLNDFEKYIIKQFNSSQRLLEKIGIHVTFNDQPIQFNLSSFNFLRASFHKYFDFTNISGHSKIFVKIKNDINMSYAHLAFFESDIVISQPNSSNLSKSILNMQSLKMLNGSTLHHENDNISSILKVKCCELDDFSITAFDEIYVENGFCSDDFSLKSSTVRNLQFSQRNNSKINYFLIINDKVKVYNALKVNIKSNGNSNLIISSFNYHKFPFNIIPKIFLCSFSQICFENETIFESVYFKIYDTKSIICKAKHLSADINNVDFYIEDDVFIDGAVDNISIFLNRILDGKKITLTIAKLKKNVNIKSSFIDINIIDFCISTPNPITFCVGKGGISKVKVESIRLGSNLTIEGAFQNLYLNRDFQTYLSDSDIEAFLYKYFNYLEIPHLTSYSESSQYEKGIIINFTDSSCNIHGFSNSDSILTAIEISNDPKIFAVYFDSPNKKLLSICLSSDLSTSNLSNDCILMENFSNDFLQFNSGVENVLINIRQNYEFDQLNFESFFIKNLTITANYQLNVQFNLLKFIGKVTSNLTIINLHNFSFNIIPKSQMQRETMSSNIDNISIFNCSIFELCSSTTEKVIIENFSTTQLLDIPSNWEISNLNYLSNYTNLTYVLSSYNKEVLFVSTFGFVNLSKFTNFNIYFPFYSNPNQDRSASKKNLYILTSSEQISKFNIYLIDNNASIFFYKWENIPDTFSDYYSDIQREASVICSTPVITSDTSNKNTLFSISHFDFNVNVYYSMQVKNINFTGSGYVLNSLFFHNKQTIQIDSIQNGQSLDYNLNKISYEEVFVDFDELITPARPEIKFSSMSNKIVNFFNKGSQLQEVSILDNRNNSSIISASSPTYKISLNKVHLIVQNEDPSHKLFFDEISLKDGASFEGLNDNEETVFRKLECTFDDLFTLGKKIEIKEELTIYGQIKNSEKTEKKIIQFLPKSLLKVTLNEKELKILIGERLIRIENFEFVGVDHAEITLDVQPDKDGNGFNYIIEQCTNEQGELNNFDLFPKISIIQTTNDQNQKKILNDFLESESNTETYKFINIKSDTNNNYIRKGIKEKIAHKFQKLPKKMNFNEHSEKVSYSKSNYLSQLANSIHLKGNWTGCDSRFTFYNLSLVNFYFESETVPFHFISTIGNLNLYVYYDKTNFLGNFLCSNVDNTPLQVNVLYSNNSSNLSNVTFCGIFGGSTEINFRLYQPKIHICFNNIIFQKELLKLHLFMSVDGYSTFTILKGSSHVDRIIYLNFECLLELTDPKITEFLNEKEKVVGLYVDSTFSDRIIIGWDVIPETHGLLESFEFYFSRRTRRLLYVMRQSPSDVPLTLCFNDYDSCEVNIYSEDHFNDIRPFLPKGKNSILMLLTDSIDSVLNLDYSFFDNFTIYMIGYGIIDMNIKFGYNHISELDLSSVSVVIEDKDNYSIDTVLASSGSIIKNINGIKRLEFNDFYDFKSNKIDSFMNRIIIPSEHDQIIFQKEGIKLQTFGKADSSFQFKSSKFPDLEIKIVDPDAIFGKPDSNSRLQFLIDEDDDDFGIVNKISINFGKKTKIYIGKGWDQFHRNTIFNDVEGLANIDQITTESFPFQPFYQLSNQIKENRLVSVYPDNILFPIFIKTNLSLSENETISLNFSQLLNSNDNFKPNISFENVVLMNDGAKMQILNNVHEEQNIDNDQDNNNNYIKIDHLIVSKGSSAFISSTEICDKLEMNENSNLFGDFIFDQNSTIIINGGFNIFANNLVKFPSIIFNSHPTTIPSRVIINVYEDTDIDYILNGKMVTDLKNQKFNEIKQKMNILNSLENTPGVFISNLGFFCSEWEKIVEISSNYSSLKSSCVNGYLKIANEKINDDPIDIVTPFPNPSSTPFRINISEYARPTMTPIVNIRNNQVDRDFVHSFISVIIVGSIFLVVIFVLLIVVINLKKKYNKLSDVCDEDENNYNIHTSDDVIKL